MKSIVISLCLTFILAIVFATLTSFAPIANAGSARLPTPVPTAEIKSRPDPKPVPTATVEYTKFDTSVLNDLIKNFQQQQIQLDQPLKQTQLVYQLNETKRSLQRWPSDRNGFSENFAKEFRGDFGTLVEFRSMKRLNIEDTATMQDVLDDLRIKTTPCDPPADNFDITVHVLDATNKEVTGAYTVRYVDASRRQDAGTPGNPGEPFAGGRPATATAPVHIGIKYFWTEDNNSSHGGIQREEIFCRSSKEIFLPAPRKS